MELVEMFPLSFMSLVISLFCFLVLLAKGLSVLFFLKNQLLFSLIFLVVFLFSVLLYSDLYYFLLFAIFGFSSFFLVL